MIPEKPGYVREMHRFRKGFGWLALILGVAALNSAVASAQGADNTYGLSNLKPYDGAEVAAPANGLDRIMSSEKAPPKSASPANKPISDPVFTIHGAGGVAVGGTIGR